jgi:hypothetical protein
LRHYSRACQKHLMRFSFYISQSQYPLARQDPNWAIPLPLSRQPVDLANSKARSTGVTTGDYFTAAASFLSKNRFEPILSAVQSLFNVAGAPGCLETIGIFLVKHGEFYHPSRVEVKLSGKTYSFVLNVAVSQAGIALMERENQLLRRLGECCPNGFLPRVFSYAQASVQKKSPVSMFLAEWFEGFYEFHLSQKPGYRGLGIVVWDDAGNYFLDDAQAAAIYEQASKILTLFYNPISFEQIFSWHHAAGDFILKADGKGIELKLITVRNYMPLTQTTPKDAGDFLDGLLMFLLILSIRMRLDRLDGTGESAWAPDLAVKATVSGFAQGLNQQAEADIIPFDLVKGFYQYVSAFSFSGLLEWASLIVERFHPDGPEIALIKSNLFNHVKMLHACIRQSRDGFLP